MKKVLFSHNENFAICADPSVGIIMISPPLEENARLLPVEFRLNKNYDNSTNPSSFFKLDEAALFCTVYALICPALVLRAKYNLLLET